MLHPCWSQRASNCKASNATFPALLRQRHRAERSARRMAEDLRIELWSTLTRGSIACHRSHRNHRVGPLASLRQPRPSRPDAVRRSSTLLPTLGLLFQKQVPLNAAINVAIESRHPDLLILIIEPHSTTCRCLAILKSFSKQCAKSGIQCLSRGSPWLDPPLCRTLLYPTC